MIKTQSLNFSQKYILLRGKEKLGGTRRGNICCQGNVRIDKAVKKLDIIFLCQTLMALLKVILKGLNKYEEI